MLSQLVNLYSPLPIDPVLPRLRQVVSGSSNTVLHAPPGAGKTSRVPLALLNLPGLGGGRIVMLEPRRLAAVHAAHRMAESLGEKVGETVGYAMRFERRVSPATRIEVVTEGILTRRLQRDPCLEGISLVIFDEFHERSLNADLALALCLEVQQEVRPDLKLLVMSATMDCASVATLLGNAPIITSEGRAFPVEVRYLQDAGHGRLPDRMAAAIRTALTETGGDILAFLPGSGEIRACHELLLKEARAGISIHPLYGDLPFAEQEKAVLPGSARKVVLATNIAETSLTIEGVRVVIDSGLSRMVRHDPASGMNRLVTVRESSASAEQRRGRAGRLGPGVCYRLFSGHTFTAMTGFSPPEITVADLSSLVLELAVWGSPDISALSWLDPPPAAAVEAAQRLLRDLGALDGNWFATERGRAMAEFPVHPRIAALLLRGREMGAPEVAAWLAALVAERDVFRHRPGENADICDSDVLERLTAVEKSVRDRIAAVDVGALRAVERTALQLSRLLGVQTGRLPEVREAGEAARMLLAAYPDRVARQREGEIDRYVLANGRGARLSSRSGVRGRPLILAIQVDAGTGSEGLIHQACFLSAELIRDECRQRLETGMRVLWDAGQERVMAWEEERIGAVVLARRQANPSDAESIPLLLSLVRTAGLDILGWDHGARQLQGRVELLGLAFPGEGWPRLGDDRLLADLEEWLAPCLWGVRSRRDLEGVAVGAALRALLSREQHRLLEERAPTHVTAPSGHRIEIDYQPGAEPVMAVKLQEMFGLADTPTVAGGRVKLLLHLLSPAGRPVQVTRDLKNFWENGYREVKRELRGRYPKHPWPDDPWNALPTRKTTRMLKKGQP